MKKMIAAVAVLAILIVCFFLLKKHNDDAAEESAASETGTQSVSIEGLPEVSGIESFSVTNANGDFTFNKDGDKWTPAEPGSDTDSDKVGQKLDDLCESSADQAMEGVTDFSQFGLDSPQITVALRESGGKETVVAVGDENPVTSQYYVRIGDSSTVYATGSSIFSAFNFTAEDVAADKADESSADASAPAN